MSANLFGHLANLVFAAAYVAKDFLWLRILSVGGCTASLFFNYYAPATPLWTAIFWNGAFASLNLVAIVRTLLRRRRRPSLSATDLHATGWLQIHLKQLHHG